MKREGFKVVEGPIDPGKAKPGRYRIAHHDGKVIRIRVIDANGPDFTADLTDAFRKSVRKARADNRKIAAPA